MNRPLHLLETILGLLNTLKLDRKISPENADFRDALDLTYEILARTDIAQRAKNESGYRFPQDQNPTIDALKINAGAIIKNQFNLINTNIMKNINRQYEIEDYLELLSSNGSEVFPDTENVADWNTQISIGEETTLYTGLAAFPDLAFISAINGKEFFVEYNDLEDVINQYASDEDFAHAAINGYCTPK